MTKTTTRSVLFLALLPLIFASCSTPRGREMSPVRAAKPSLACRLFDGLEPLVDRGAGLLLGEMHGTAESPEFVATAACLALHQGLGVTVALEIPREEQGRIDAYLASGGSADDRSALLSGPFWQAEYQDGRRSRAMLGLLDELRQMRGGRDLKIALIDRAQAPQTSAERDRWMADALARAFNAQPTHFLVSLTGNVHARLERGTPWDPNYEPAGFVLRRAHPELKLTALDVSYARGSAWICQSADAASCGARDLKGRGAEVGGRITWFPEIKGGYGGAYEVGLLTASPPAKTDPNLP